MIIYESLLNTFEGNVLFEAVDAVSKIGSSPKSKYH